MNTKTILPTLLFLFSLSTEAMTPEELRQKYGYEIYILKEGDRSSVAEYAAMIMTEKMHDFEGKPIIKIVSEIAADDRTGFIAQVMALVTEKMTGADIKFITGSVAKLGIDERESFVRYVQEIVTRKQGEHSTGQDPWYLGRPKGRGQAALAPCLPDLDVLCSA